VVDRLVQGLSGLALSLRRRPVIRYQRNSEYARRVAESLHSLTYKQQVPFVRNSAFQASAGPGGVNQKLKQRRGLPHRTVQAGVFDFGSHRTSPVVLLLDRRDDPVTPLLTQWTYQVGAPLHTACVIMSQPCCIHTGCAVRHMCCIASWTEPELPRSTCAGRR
jgi:vacuolar protein sorting-associated protein 45